MIISVAFVVGGAVDVDGLAADFDVVQCEQVDAGVVGAAVVELADKSADTLKVKPAQSCPPLT